MTSTNTATLDHVYKVTPPEQRKSKVICTLGPACWSVEGLIALIDAGMNVARFNFSHGNHESHGACLGRLREAMAARPGCNVAVMLDTKGPEIRTGKVDPSLGGKVKYVKGTTIEVGTDYAKPCTPEYLALSYKSLPTSVKAGGKILVADGALSLMVTEVKDTSVMATVLNNAAFGDTKNCNLPGCIVDLPTLTPKDIDDLQNFGVKNGVDYIAASFVRKGADIDNIRDVLGDGGKGIKIICKIENQEGLQNYDEILEKTDGVMVARGDMGMEIPIEKVFLAQKMMITKANIMGKPIVTATQMLESMITNPRPTRAECADVANAILDGSDCVMLSGETANGEYSVEAVKMMAGTCVEAESLIDYDSTYTAIRAKVLEKFSSLSAEESICSSAVKTAFDTKAKLIVTVTECGKTARLVSKYHPACPILALTKDPQVARTTKGYMRSVTSSVITSLDNAIAEAIQGAVGKGLVSKGDAVVCIESGATSVSVVTV